MRKARCWPTGVPTYDIGFYYFVQTPKVVLMVWHGDHAVRHIYLDVPSQNLKLSWYGESVGHHEGDALVVDTIGQNTQTFVDNYRTPHSEKLHVVERFPMINDGMNLRGDIFMEDAAAFKQPLHVTHIWRRMAAVEHGDRGQSPLDEQSCAEAGGNFAFSTDPDRVEPIPTAAKSDFGGHSAGRPWTDVLHAPYRKALGGFAGAWLDQKSGLPATGIAGCL